MGDLQTRQVVFAEAGGRRWPIAVTESEVVAGAIAHDHSESTGEPTDVVAVAEFESLVAFRAERDQAAETERF
jgi:hypothetical protein